MMQLAYIWMKKHSFFFFGRCDRFLVFKFHTLMTFSVLKLLRDLVLIYPSKSQTFYQTGNRKAICCDFYRPLKTLNHLQKSARQRKEPDSLNKKNLWWWLVPMDNFYSSGGGGSSKSTCCCFGTSATIRVSKKLLDCNDHSSWAWKRLGQNPIIPNSIMFFSVLLTSPAPFFCSVFVEDQQIAMANNNESLKGSNSCSKHKNQILASLNRSITRLSREFKEKREMHRLDAWLPDQILIV